MTKRLRTWAELVATPLDCDPRSILPNRDMLEDVSIDIRRVAAAIVGLDPDAPDEEPREPTEEEIDAWMRPCAGWKAWGPHCLVCHDDVPEGQAVGYPSIFGSRACIGDCSAHVDSLLRMYDRSPRGRWRPMRQVHDLANGAYCNVPHEVSA